MEPQNNIFIAIARKNPTSDSITLRTWNITTKETKPLIPSPLGDKPSCYEARCSSCPFRSKCRNADKKKVFTDELPKFKISTQ
jgi:hypothetical protein